MQILLLTQRTIESESKDFKMSFYSFLSVRFEYSIETIKDFEKIVSKHKIIEKA